MAHHFPVWRFYHEISKDHSLGHPPIAADSSEWPEAWKKTEYKTYPRFEKIDLSPIRTAQAREENFFRLTERRASTRSFSREPISMENFSVLLKYSCGETGEFEPGRLRRAQPSGGARFPVEIYLVVFRNSKDTKAGVYHYDIRGHRLESLIQRDFTGEDIKTLFTYQWVKDASSAIILTAVFRRTTMKYGERGYRYALIEAGHIGQNIALTAEALGLGCCMLGGSRDESIEELLGVDGEEESIIYAAAIGNKE